MSLAATPSLEEGEEDLNHRVIRGWRRPRIKVKDLMFLGLLVKPWCRLPALAKPRIYIRPDSKDPKIGMEQKPTTTQTSIVLHWRSVWGPLVFSSQRTRSAAGKPTDPQKFQTRAA